MTESDKKARFFNRVIYDKATHEPLSLAEKVFRWERYEEAKKIQRKINKENKALFDQLSPEFKKQLEEMAGSNPPLEKKKKEIIPQFKLWHYFCKLPQNKGLTQKEKSSRYRELSNAAKLQLEYELDNSVYDS